MSPRMEADFNWGEVQTSTPIFRKGDYELTTKRIRGSAWPKMDEHGNETGVVTQVIRVYPEMVGEYNSKGKLSGTQDKREIKGMDCESIDLWLHSEGGRRMAKSHMMAICGFNPNDPQDEKKFNESLEGLDLHVEVTERDDGGLGLDIGDGYEKLLVGKNVRAQLEPEIRRIEGREDIEQQNFVRLSPVNG